MPMVLMRAEHGGSLLACLRYMATRLLNRLGVRSLPLPLVLPVVRISLLLGEVNLYQLRGSPPKTSNLPCIKVYEHAPTCTTV